MDVDDFGISRGVNRAVIAAHEAGVVTSASLMVNGDAVMDAVRAAREHPGLSVGLHVNFTNDGGRPPLVDLDDPVACCKELDAQVAGFRDLMGYPPTHLDSHHHVHERRLLRPCFVEAAAGLGIPLRGSSSTVRWFGSFYADWDDETHPEQVGFDSLREMLRGFGPGVTELSSHIGFVDPELDSEYHAQRELELATILDPRLPALFEALGIELIGYADLVDDAEEPGAGTR